MSGPPLAVGDVHVWRARLDLDAGTLADLRQTLSSDERARADRFHFPKHRDAFIAGRGLLRRLLGGYLGRGPAELQFVTNVQGKPALADAGMDLRFNLSHSHGLAVYAVTRGREVGVDVERVRAELASDGIAERYFSPQEVAALRALPSGQRTQAFFQCWTRKEAYLKALGTGLTLPLDSFDVSLGPDVPAALLAARHAAADLGRWSLCALDVPAEYVAALVLEGDAGRLWCGDCVLLIERPLDEARE